MFELHVDEAKGVRQEMTKFHVECLNGVGFHVEVLLESPDVGSAPPNEQPCLQVRVGQSTLGFQLVGEPRVS